MENVTKNSQPGDECFENVWAKDNKIVTTATVYDKDTCASKEHDPTKLVIGVR